MAARDIDPESQLGKLTAANTAPISERKDVPAPKGWERGRSSEGDVGVGSTGALDPDELLGLTEDEESWLLKKAGYKPEEWRIVGDHSYREWDANLGGGVIKTLQYRRFNVRKRGLAANGVEELLDLVGQAARPVERVAGTDGGRTHVFATGDWQLGKIDGDGTAGSIRRVSAGIAESAALLRDAFLRGEVGNCHIAFMADCGEYFVSQNGANAWRTDLSISETLRITRRLMLEAIKAHAPYCERLTVVAVPGNHDQTSRAPMTYHGDSFDTDCLVAVTDLLEENPQAFGHVETYVPPRDSKFVTLDVNGTRILHLHGEDVRPHQHFNWWRGQAFEPGSDAANAQVMLFAHQHHFMVDTSNGRTAIMSPSTEDKSIWFSNKTGVTSKPGSLVFHVEDGEANGYRIVGSDG
jgi:hypothetical protein